jgi:hypothetical protein
MPLDQFLDVPDGPSRSLVVANRTEPEPFQRMLEKLFTDQAITVSESVETEYDENTVLLVEDGTVVATSPLQALTDAILMVNSDLFITGARKLDTTTVPDVIDGLTDVPFRLRGYPESDTEKLLLILISRHIERLAHEAGDGRLRSSFQRLSRINDEKGTREVYETVAETAVDVHVYGRPDWTPSEQFDVTMHGGYKRDFRRSWFVIYNPPAELTDTSGAALLAIQTDDGVWDGFWTYDQSIVDDLTAYIRTNL